MNERDRTTPDRGRIGIFRRVAVERYSQAIEPDLPEMLIPLNPGWIIAGAGLLAFAVAVLWFG